MIAADILYLAILLHRTLNAVLNQLLLPHCGQETDINAVKKSPIGNQRPQKLARLYDAR
jgi:hypothetical protein